MTRRVTRIAPWQAGKFFAVLYFFIGLIFGCFFALVALFAPPEQTGIGMGFAIAFPFIYALGALIFVPIACLIFNGVAKLVGGLDFEVVDHDTRPA
jgi:hypothetical protein